MAETPSGPPEPLDLQKIRYLVRLMKRYDVTALDVSDESLQIRLRRGSAEVSHRAPPPPPPPPPPAAVSAAPTQASPPAAESPENRMLIIESPMVGTYYASSSPETPPFVAAGSRIGVDTTVCIIEAMKVFTDIPAGIAGVIVETMVKNGQPVEFGQPLFRVRPD